ncbi:MAG: apolipoprotein N-acyltransferase [Thiobacillus sp.]|nr:apolipoprotein N-acyltransferase [Thiobacillus sp.]
MRRAGHRTALFLVGAVAVAGFAPLGWWPLTWLALVVLFVSLARADSPRQGFAHGMAWGLGFFVAGVSWVYVSLHVYGGMAAPLAALATLLFCAFLALFPAAAGAMAARIAGTGARVLLALPLAWSTMEWTRGWIFTGFPWLGLGYSQIPDGPLAGFAPIVGIYGVNSLLALSAALAAWAWITPGTPARLGALAAIALLGAVGQGLHAHAWTHPEGAPSRVALLQGNVPQNLKWRPEATAETLALYARLARSSPADLIVMPETALPIFEADLPDAYRHGLQQLGRQNGGDVLVGLPTGQLDGAYYNSVISLGTAPGQRYHKSHLVPFGEYIPQKAVWGWVLDVLHIPLSDFARGAPDQAPLAVGGQRVAMNICYEDAFGEEIIRALPAATLLANVSNLAWFGDSLAPWQHAQMSQARALETGRMMLRATNTGLTAIIDTRGRVVAALPLFETGALQGNVQGYAGATPYVRWGNTPVLLVWGGAALMLVWRRLRRTGQPDARTR